MKFKTLQDIALSELVKTFNSSFSDYIVPLQLSEEQLAKKMKNDGINPEISAGAFENGELTGFILHGEGNFNGIQTVYNGGTGVVPSKRGNKITRRLYEFILPILIEAGFDQCSLEVISTNIPAIKVYESLGFEKTRELVCFKGSVYDKNIRLIKNCALNEPALERFDVPKGFCDWVPSWQNSREAIQRASHDLKTLSIENNKETVAYLIYNPATARISQFAVNGEYRNLGIGTLLFQELYKKLSKEISILNIDSNALETISFLKSVGLRPYINQYEMLMEL